MEPSHTVQQEFQGKKIDKKKLTKEKKTHLGDHLHPNEYKKEIILGFINIHTLPESCKGEKYFDLTNMMFEKRFDHIGLADTGRHWPSLPYENKTPHPFRG